MYARLLGVAAGTTVTAARAVGDRAHYHDRPLSERVYALRWTSARGLTFTFSARGGRGECKEGSGEDQDLVEDLRDEVRAKL